MKLLHAGLLVVGAAVAGGMAVRMTEPPPLPSQPDAAEVVSPLAPAPTPSVVHAAAPQAPPPQQPAPVVPTPPAEIASPPPVYAEPPHVTKPSPAPKPIKPQLKPPVTVAETVPVPGPAVYQEPPVRMPEPEPAPPPARTATLRPGSDVAVRLLQTLSADRVQPGDMFQGVIAEPVVADGFVIAERGAPVTGRVVQVQNGAITLRLLNMETADGQRVEVSTEPWSIRLVSGQSVVRFRLAARITVKERKL
jgi:hypothetical protein